ncbi:MAG TPA: hypothetical protein ENJ00_06590 [Phycisphaerales bacterium]|nr:hypothetical protein [Phycisphaerales bacterium]
MKKHRGVAVVVLSALVGSAGGQSFGTWQSDTPLPTNGQAKTYSFGIELNGTKFVLGGPPWFNGSEDGSVYSLAPGATNWVEEIGFDGYGALISQGGGVDALGRIIVFGGDDPQNPGSTKPPFEWNQIEGPWNEHAARSAQAPAMYFAETTDSAGRIYSIGGGPGESATVGNPNSTYAERFIGSSDTWEPIAPLPIATADAAASPDGLGHILVFGGISADGSTRLSEVQRYDLATDSWSTVANTDMPVALSGHEATLGADGRIFILGGASGPIGAETVEKTTWVYDPMTDSWQAGPDMAEARRWFASFLASDDMIYAIGGDNSTGGSYGVEKLYTTPCPVFTAQPTDQTRWQYAKVTMSAPAYGGGTITYQWKHDGVALVDGPSVGGGTISGATTDTLTIDQAGANDAGFYQVEATNSCGTTQSNVALLTINTPVDLPTQWTFTSLHPSVATSSYATGVDHGVQVGRAVYDDFGYLNIDHPYIWQGSAASGQNMTQPDSPGGSIVDFAGNYAVGWWWEPIQCYVNHQWQTCYYQRAAWWDTTDGSFHSTNYSGYEYTIMNGTDGTSIVGTGSYDDAVGNYFSRAVIWQGADFSFASSIHPSVGNTNSSLIAVDGNTQFGNVTFTFGGVHAGIWQGSAASFVDLNPAGATKSTATDASDGQQVGIIDQFTNPHAGIWTGTPESFVDLTPDGALTSRVTACEAGIQLGSVDFGDGLGYRTVLWGGSKDVYVEIANVLPTGYAGLNLVGMDVEPDGTISLVGSAYNQTLGRTEAVMIRSTTDSPCLPDVNGDGNLDPADFTAWIAAFNANDPAADQNQDGSIDPSDFTAWIANFNAGCP